MPGYVNDVNRPNLDGIGFIRQLRQRPHYKFTSIMMLTTESQEAKKRESKEAGAKAWLVKPFQPLTLLSAVAKLA